MSVILFNVFNGCSSPIKEINRLTSNVKHLLLRKTDILKTSSIFCFLRKKIWRSVLALKSKKVQGIFGDTFIWHCRLELSFIYKTVSQISFSLFCLGEKGLLSEFLRKWGWFHGHNECFPKQLLLQTKEKTWKHIFNNNSELLQKRTEKQTMSFKTTVNWLFNSICYLAIGCFDCKIGFFQQTVVKFYYILNTCN